MDDKTISKICLIITIIGILLFAATYEEEFTKKSIAEIKSTPGEKGIVFGRIEYIIKTYPVTQFTLTDGDKATIYYPKATTLKKDDFVTTYLENQNNNPEKKDNQMIYAHKVVKE